ncbi:MAG TPA: ABC transporter permease [Acidimicrobiales bacterium]|nr:ABC transporter permease [Acidimicrobiales bacterium]
MSTTLAPLPPGPVAGPGRLARAVADGWTVTWRNLIAYTRIPQALVFSTVQPIVLVLLFRYVFGGAIAGTPVPYEDFMLPGVFAQAISFGAVGTAVALADDMQKGLIERFRSLPMARSAVLVGRTSAELVRNVFVVALMTLVGFLVGFNYYAGLPAFLGGILLLLLFGYALSWTFTSVGLTAANAEVAQAKAFPILFPLIFASSAFVPVDTMPGWLQGFARNQPVSVIIDAARALMIGGPTTEILLKALAWSTVVLVAASAYGVHRYRKAL